VVNKTIPSFTSYLFDGLPIFRFSVLRTVGVAVLVALAAVGAISIPAAAQESAVTKTSPIDGIWLGTLPAGTQSLRIQIIVSSDSQGQEHCSVDSIDQGAFNIDCANVGYTDRHLNFDVPAFHGHWAGELSADQNSLVGNWNQGVPVALNLARQSKRWSPPPVASYTAIAPVRGADNQ
jgi:hypothetical protein